MCRDRDKCSQKISHIVEIERTKLGKRLDRQGRQQQWHTPRIAAIVSNLFEGSDCKRGHTKAPRLLMPSCILGRRSDFTTRHTRASWLELVAPKRPRWPRQTRSSSPSVSMQSTRRNPLPSVPLQAFCLDQGQLASVGFCRAKDSRCQRMPRFSTKG
jgi:hypothetical protein